MILMFHSYEQVDRAVFESLSRIFLDGNEVPVFVGMPEEEVIQKETYPAISMWMIDERPGELKVGPGVTVQEIKKEVPTDPTTFGLFETPIPLIWVYQIDVYSKSREELVRLLREVTLRLPHQRGALIDPDGYTVKVTRTDYRDLSRLNVEDRVMRVSLTYELSGLMQIKTDPIETYGIVEFVKVTVTDADPPNPDPDVIPYEGSFKHVLWVEEKPTLDSPEPEEP